MRAYVGNDAKMRMKVELTSYSIDASLALAPVYSDNPLRVLNTRREELNLIRATGGARPLQRY